MSSGKALVVERPFPLCSESFCPLQQERKKDELKEVEDVDIRVFPPPCVFMRPPITRPSPSPQGGWEGGRGEFPLLPSLSTSLSVREACLPENG